MDGGNGKLVVEEGGRRGCVEGNGGVGFVDFRVFGVLKVYGLGYNL